MRPPVGCNTGSRAHWYREGRDDGRREMLWLMAVGACWGSWFAIDRLHPDAVYALSDVGRAALRALADLGDEQAREMLR